MNIWLVLQLLQFLFFWGSDFPEEFHVNKLISVAQNDKSIAFAHTEGLAIRVSIYDFATNSIIKVDDGRVITIFPALIAYKDGFVILNSIPTSSPKANYVDRQGKWIWTKNLSSVPGWEAGGSFRYSVQSAQGEALLTTQHEDFVVFHLYDIDKNLITKVGEIPLEPNTKNCGVLRDNFVYAICSTNGQITSYQVDTWQKKVLQKPKDRKNKSILGFPYVVGDRISMHHYGSSDDSERVNCLNLLPNNLLEFSARLLVGQYQGKKLYYDVYSGEFSFD